MQPLRSHVGTLGPEGEGRTQKRTVGKVGKTSVVPRAPGH